MSNPLSTLESAIAEARRAGSPLHAALSKAVGDDHTKWSRLCVAELLHEVIPHRLDRSYIATELFYAVIEVRDGVYQWREPVPAEPPGVARAAVRWHRESMERVPAPTTTCTPSTCAPECPAEIPDDGGPLVLRRLEFESDIDVNIDDAIYVLAIERGDRLVLTDDEALKLSRMLTLAVQRRRAAQRARKAGDRG